MLLFWLLEILSGEQDRVQVAEVGTFSFGEQLFGV